jgi:hypothetical protein
VDEPVAERPLSLSVDEVELLLHLLSDEIGREWRHDRGAKEDVSELHRKLVELRAGWPEPRNEP